MFKLELYDRKGVQLSLGDIVKVSDGARITFFAEVKYLEKENCITPFHTFTFHSFEKVDKLPENTVKSNEERYNIWYLNEDVEDESAKKEFDDYLKDWRACEIMLEKRCFRIQIDNSDYKAKYEKCISVIKRFDAGIIGMYDL